MSLTYEEAYDEILTLLKDAWDPTTYTMHWEGVDEERDMGQDPWATVMVRHAQGNQSTLGGKGQRQFLRIGVVMIDLNTPSTSSLSGAYQLAKVVADAYEGVSSPNGVWFRNVRINENGRNGSFNRITVVAEFEYYETK